MTNSKLSQEQRNSIIELFASGTYTYADLARKFNVSSRTITRIVRPDVREKDRETNRKNMAANKEAQAIRDAENYTHFKLKFHNVNDIDIIDKLNTVPNRQGYVKEIIRTDISNPKN